MKKFKNNYYQIPLNMGSIRRIGHLLLILAFAICYRGISAQISECAGVADDETSDASSITDPTPPESCYPDFTDPPVYNLDNYDLKCVRIKFHYLNNTNDPSLAPSNAFYYDLLERINAVFAPGKIRFTMDDNCIHVADPLIMADYTIDSQKDVLSLIGKDEFDHDPYAVNVYTLQKIFLTTFPGPPTQDPIYQFWANTFKTAVVRLDNLPLIIHELGHTLGLIHTFGGGDGFDLSKDPTIMALTDCKLQGATIFSTLRCTNYGDLVCDTGLDPWDLDIGPSPAVADGVKDFHKWVDIQTCSQKEDLLPEYKDACFDCAHEWDIPSKNYMSYYRTCRSEFTTGQFCRMHDKLLTNDGSAILMNCAEDPYLNYSVCTEADFIIDTPGTTTWSNLTQTLCPGQKIVIRPGSKLILDHCILTRQETSGPNSSCPDLSFETLWDGIYIEGNPGLNVSHGIYGELEITNSTLEYSKNGIQAMKGFQGIRISSSTFQHNMAQLNLRYPYTYSLQYAQQVYLSESNFIVGDPDLSLTPLSPVQIKVMAGNLVFKECTLTNPNEDIEMTGIQSFKGNLAIINGSKIENFHIGVNKTGYGFYAEIPRGLTVISSTIKNCDVSILNSSFFATVAGNFLEGDVISESFCYGNWLSNNINAATMTLQSPLYANRIENNLFHKVQLDLYSYNKKSNATCNTWEDVEDVEDKDAVVGHTDVVLKLAWGDASVSSGNRHLDNTDPLMIAEDDLINYYYQNEPTELFSYEPLTSDLIGEESGENEGCTRDYPTTEPVPIVNFPEVELNYTTENTKWSSLNTLRGVKVALLPTATDPEKIILHQEIDQIDFEMDNIVGNVLGSITKADSAIVSTWKARANPLLFKLTSLIELWYKQDFDDLSDSAELIAGDDAETLFAASDFLFNRLGSTRRLDSLTTAEVDTLSNIAETTFGFYSNIVRDFLLIQYNVDIPWPTDNQITYRSTSKPSRNSAKVKTNQFNVSYTSIPGCITIQSSEAKSRELFVTLYDTQGRRIDSKHNSDNTDVCFEGRVPGIYILTIFDTSSNMLESHKIIIH